MKGKFRYCRFFLRNLPGTLKEKFFHKARSTKSFLGHRHLGVEKTDEILSRLLASGKPFAAIRIGGMELSAVNGYEKIRLGIKKTYSDSVRHVMKTNAGFYPTDDESLSRYGKEMIELFPEVDVLGVYGCHMENYFVSTYFSKDVEFGTYEAFEPLIGHYSKCLKGKKVLVISPFEEEILSQYEKRKLLFENADEILPEMQLSVLKPPMSQGDEAGEFPSFFEGLEDMYAKMDAIDYDVLLVGAGAYGAFLAVHAKGKGKQAIQSGGATMTLFGIMGKRWEHRNHVAKHYNEHWIRPKSKIKGYEKIDQGAYW